MGRMWIGANVGWGGAGRIPYWGCKSNLCGADLEGGGASNLTGADRGRMWIGAVSPASPALPNDNPTGCDQVRQWPAARQ